MMDRLLTVKRASRIIGVHRKTLERWCREGTVESIKTPGGEYRLPRDVVEALRTTDEDQEEGGC